MSNLLASHSLARAVQMRGHGGRIAARDGMLPVGLGADTWSVAPGGTIRALPAMARAAPVMLRFEGATTLVHSAKLGLPGGVDHVTAAGDMALCMPAGRHGGWQAFVMPALPPQSGASELATEQATTSGTSIDFTGIPSWAKRITVMLDGVSTNGITNLLVQLGDSGGIETSGYAGGYSNIINGSSPAVVNLSSGFVASGGGSAASVTHGSLTLTLMDASNTWAAAGIFNRSDTVNTIVVSGTKTLSAALDRIRLTASNGTDAFDAGSVNIMCSA